MTPSRVDKIRRGLGLDFSEFAKALNVSLTTVHGWENVDGTGTCRYAEPRGLAAEVLRGLEATIEETYRTMPKEEAVHELIRLGRVVALGIGALICYGLLDLSLMGGHDEVQALKPARRKR
jgi:DNA-binding XRE family transcriptional regulator